MSETPADNPENNVDSAEEQQMHVASRREKMRKIEELGLDPWGSRFDDRLLISEIRARVGEVQYQKEDGTLVDLPELDVDPEQRVNMREWRAEQGPGSEIGPQVRAAGRIMLKRDKGKLCFIDIQDWSGRLQLFIGKKQVGEADFELAGLFDLGDIIGIDGRLGVTNTGELTIFAEKLHFLTKSIEPPPAKHLGMTDPELRQRRRYVDLAYNEGVQQRFLNLSNAV